MAAHARKAAEEDAKEGRRCSAMVAYLLGSGRENETLGQYWDRWELSEKPKRKKPQMSKEELLEWGINKLREQGIEVKA